MCDGGKWIDADSIYLHENLLNLLTPNSESSENSCPYGWKVMPSQFRSGSLGCRCYRYFEYKTKWSEAQKYCRKEYSGNLSSIFDLEHLDWLWREVAGGNSFWIGLNRWNRESESGWLYSDGFQGRYRNWAPSAELDEQQKRCATVSEKLSWQKVRCSQTNRFLCQMDCSQYGS